MSDFFKIEHKGEVFELSPPLERDCPPEKLIDAKTNPLGKVYNTYGGGLEQKAKDYDLDPATALAVFATEAGNLGAFTEYGLTVIRVEARPPLIKAKSRFSGGGAEFKQRFGNNGQNSEYKALIEWYDLEGERAFNYTSFGLPQVMGFNFASVALKSPTEVFRFSQESARNQIELFFRFISSNKMLYKAAKGKDWRTFARYYNGSGQVDAYSKILAKNYSYAQRLFNV